MRPILLAAFLLFSLSFIKAHSQNADSFARALDSSSKAIQQTTKDIERWKDSLRQKELQRFTDQNSKNLDLFLADMKERERKEKQQAYIRIGLGVAFLAVLIIGLIRRRKKKSSAPR
jgi:hypothetical protein